MLENLGDFESLEWKPANNARCFECGSPNNLGIQAMHASLNLILKIGIERIYEMISTKISYLYERYKKYNYKIISDMDINRRSGIITMQRLDIDNYRLFKYLLKSNVLCAYRNNGIRFSPHFYSGLDEIDMALELINSFES